MRPIAIAAVTFALAACGERIEPQPSGMYEIPPVEWYVVDRATLEATYLNSGMHIGTVEIGGRIRKDNLTGFAGYRDGQAVVYTLPPRTVDDAVTCTFGHEVMHIALGAYHR